MGLAISHGTFRASYSAFNRFRQAVAKAIGGSWPPHEDKSLDPDTWYWHDSHKEGDHPGIEILMQHSDCEGEISAADAAKVADDLEAILPLLDAMGEGGGHIQGQGGYGAVARRFIAGCRAAYDANEPLEFS
jgi:hypothetical protein